MADLKIKQYPDGIEIVRSWLDHQAVVATAAALLWANTIRDFPTGGAGGEGPGVWLFRVFAAFAAGLGYYAMCGMLNRSHIAVRQGWISVSHGPLPTFFLVRNVSLEMSQVQELSVLRRWLGGGGMRSAPSTFDVYAVTHDRRSIRVVQGVSSLEEAEAIKREIQGRLAHGLSRTIKGCSAV